MVVHVLHPGSLVPAWTCRLPHAASSEEPAQHKGQHSHQDDVEEGETPRGGCRLPGDGGRASALELQQIKLALDAAVVLPGLPQQVLQLVALLHEGDDVDVARLRRLVGMI